MRCLGGLVSRRILRAGALRAGALILVSGSAFADPAPTPPPRPADLTAAPAAAPPAADVPRPPQRPADLPDTIAKPEPAASSAQPLAPEKDAAACKALLESGTVLAQAVPPIVEGEACGIAAPVALRAIVLPDGRAIRMEPAPRIRCDLAAALARWLREDVVSSLAARGLTLDAITTADAYSCRSRNHVAGAKISEHASGNAIDLDAFVFAGGRHVALTSADAATFAGDIRASACARFATVLGPGADAYHDTHIHLDLEDRRSHGGLCEWDLR